MKQGKTQQIIEKTARIVKALEEDPGNPEYIEALILTNLPLVTTITAKYKPYSEDNFQTGCIGLIVAANMYDSSKGISFGSFASFCIEREIQKAYKERMSKFDMLDAEQRVYLDSNTTLDNGDTVDMYDYVSDEKAQKELDEYVEKSELLFVCDNIIKPVIEYISNRGHNNKKKTDEMLWRKLEYVYIIDLLSMDSQKTRFNLTQFAKACNLSVTRVRARHEQVMDEIFQRMWGYMTLSFSELMVRLRGNKKIPSRLLCLDPGKTTGWCLFEKGKLTKWGQLPECYNDNNIDTKPLLNLFSEIQPDFILYEDYKVYAHKLERHVFNPVFTLRLIGCIETYIQINGIKSHKQMAVTAKNFVTDEKLKNWGFWQPGMRHSRDAIRHGCYFLLFYNKGEDILC